MRDRAHEVLRKAVRNAVPAVMAVAALTMSGSAWAVVPSHCVSVEVPAPVILPDGSIHPAGELRMCLTRNYNPVTGLHRIYLDGMPVGMLLSRASLAEVPVGTRPEILFHGNLRSGLRLVGYTVPLGGKVFSYLLRNTREARDVQVAEGSAGASGESETVDSESVLLAARLE